MDTRSPGQVAIALGTSRKRVQAAAEHLGIGERTPSGWTRFSAAEEALLRDRLGISQRGVGLSVTQSRVLAALARHPRGVASRRSLAVMAGLSPTAASHAADALLTRGLAYERAETRALGRARDVTVIYANRDHPQWERINSEIQRIRAPRKTPARSRALPGHLRHAFWNLDPAAYRRLRTDVDGAYIAARALSTGDLELLGWAAENLPAEAWRTAAAARGQAPATRALALNLAKAAADLDDDTLNAVFGATKVQFLRSTGQTDIEEPSKIAGIKVAGLRDLVATKLKVILDRGELRDYFDVMVLDQRYPQAVEHGLTDYRLRYADQNDNNLFGIIRSLGYLADVTDDPGLPVPRADIESFWQRRQPEVIRNLQSMGTNP